MLLGKCNKPVDGLADDRIESVHGHNHKASGQAGSGQLVAMLKDTWRKKRVVLRNDDKIVTTQSSGVELIEDVKRCFKDHSSNSGNKFNAKSSNNRFIANFSGKLKVFNLLDPKMVNY